MTREALTANTDRLQMFGLMPAPDASQSSAIVWVIGLMIVFSLGLVVWYRWFTPLARLKRHLIQGTIDPRETGHKLAQWVSDDQLLNELNTLRFTRDAPSVSDLCKIIDKAKRHV